jgi:FAD/FMN-containing dehydrogenase
LLTLRLCSIDPVDAPALTAFREGFSGEVIDSGDPAYDDARRVWNGMIDRRPALVVRPRSSDDVVAAIRFGREQELPIAVRGGGHSIPGFSTVDDGIVVDLSAFGGVHVDPEARTARVGGGALLAELDRAAQAQGLVCPVGVVGHTGVGGLTLGGGMGRLQRRFGLTIDNLLGVELVTADGRVVRAGEDENPDLFWGLRGAGANFGVVTAFELRLHPLDHPVTFGTVAHPIERAGELAGLLRDVLETAPAELWASYGLGSDTGEPIAQVTVMHSGRPDAAERDLAPLRAFGPPRSDTIESQPHVRTQTLFDDAQAWGHRFSMKSAFLPELSDELVARGVEHVTTAAAGIECGMSLWSCGGAMAEVPNEATAFTGRDAAFWVASDALWDDPARDGEARAWVREAIAEVLPLALEGRYVNDVAEAGADPRSIYGSAKYDRLVALKREWDPDNVFRLNQNIQP